jgi:hypothetical protein
LEPDEMKCKRKTKTKLLEIIMDIGNNGKGETFLK